jgi:hypothetical protein
MLVKSTLKNNLNVMRKNKKGEFVGIRTNQQIERDKKFKDSAIKLIKDSGDNWAIHSLAVMKRNALARVIYLNDVYKKIINVPGVICEFGVHWGSTNSVLNNLRALYEPYNHSRVVYGFDTFSGFNSVSSKDGRNLDVGDYSSREDYFSSLNEILSYHESICPFPENKKFELIKGDASITTKQWLTDNPHAIISLAIFDMDLYKPTKDVLTAIQPRLTKGSVVVFDELNCKFFPGETEAVAEVLGFNNIKLEKHFLQNYCAMYEVI